MLKSSIVRKDLIKLADLPFGEYPITEFAFYETRFGPRVKLDLGDKYVFLPPSVSKHQNPESVAALNTVKQIFVWNGYGDGQFEPFVCFLYTLTIELHQQYFQSLYFFSFQSEN